MATVKCVMMQRDESLLLEPWLRYYGYLFGYENLTVFDNGSVLEPVIATLRRYERIGVKIYWDFAGEENFRGKAFHFTNVIKGWDFGGDYDFALPVDCDEFMAVITRDGLDCGRQAIHASLDSLKAEKRVLGIEFSMFNVPGRPGCYRPQFYPKGFFARDTIKVLDHGYHYPIAQMAGRLETELTYLHYHHKPFPLMLDHAKRKLAGMIDIDHPETAVGYTGSGNHLVKFLMMSERDYQVQFDDSLLVRFDALERLLTILGPLDNTLFAVNASDNEDPLDSFLVRMPNDQSKQLRFAPFSEETYYQLNPDVAANGIEGLKHYFRHGFVEGRPIQFQEARRRARTA